ncbi:MAG TPA: hypothetical protein VKS98_02725, partial [Chthoniobacterales bacterium]|nr:hypothetical protein [Chthoniobacterales bacterium]
MNPCCFKRAIWVTFIVLALHARIQAFADQAGCDDCVPKDQFQDSDWKGKKDDPKKPPHRLKTPTCDGCKDAVKALQDALDDCNAKALEDLKDIDYSKDDASEKQTRKNAAKDALRGTKNHKPPKGKSAKQLQEIVNDKCKKVQRTCPNNQPGGNGPVPAEPGPQPNTQSTPSGPEKPPLGGGDGE